MCINKRPKPTIWQWRDSTAHSISLFVPDSGVKRARSEAETETEAEAVGNLTQMSRVRRSVRMPGFLAMVNGKANLLVRAATRSA